MLPPSAPTTITYLDNLVSRGFSDKHFRGEGTVERPRVHHYGRGGYLDGYSKAASITQHRKYPEDDSKLEGNNVVVRDRLAFLDECSSDFLDASDGAAASIPDENWWEWIREANELFPLAPTGRQNTAATKPCSPTHATPPPVSPPPGAHAEITSSHSSCENHAIPSQPGLYLAIPLSAEDVPITRDPRHTATCARVNRSHVKFGRAVSLLGRFRYGYSKDFPGNIHFVPLVTLDAAVLVRAESAVKSELNRFRIRSPKGRPLEWLQGVTPDFVAQIVSQTLARESIPASY